MALGRDVGQLEEAGEVQGVVRSSGNNHGIFVALLAKTGDHLFREEEHGLYLSVANRKGKFSFPVVPAGEYEAFAFLNEDVNLRYQDGDPFGFDVGPIVVSPDGAVTEVELALSKAKAGHQLPATIASRLPELNQRLATLNLGKVIDLSEDTYSRDNGVRGLWEPLEFVRDGLFGIHFLEPYSPDKIPVLYVHGISAAPQDHSSFIDALDRDVFQPWVVFYPSGLPLGGLSFYIHLGLEVLQTQHEFEEIYIVAHSMGGLVSRAVINRNTIDPSWSLGLFVSVSSPWQGHGAAKLGKDLSPVTAPSWVDMTPGSEFLKTLFQTPLPEETDYFLLFGYSGSSMLTSGNDDGTVSLSSVLADEAQQEAKRIHAFDEDHMSILKSQKAIARLQSILAEAASK